VKTFNVISVFILTLHETTKIKPNGIKVPATNQALQFLGYSILFIVFKGWSIKAKRAERFLRGTSLGPSFAAVKATTLFNITGGHIKKSRKQKGSKWPPLAILTGGDRA